MMLMSMSELRQDISTIEASIHRGRQTGSEIIAGIDKYMSPHFNAFLCSVITIIRGLITIIASPPSG